MRSSAHACPLHISERQSPRELESGADPLFCGVQISHRKHPHLSRHEKPEATHQVAINTVIRDESDLLEVTPCVGTQLHVIEGGLGLVPLEVVTKYEQDTGLTICRGLVDSGDQNRLVVVGGDSPAGTQAEDILGQVFDDLEDGSENSRRARCRQPRLSSPSSTDTLIVSPSPNRPSRMEVAIGSARSFCNTRFSGLAP